MELARNKRYAFSPDIGPEKFFIRASEKQKKCPEHYEIAWDEI